jgi:8-oxo-dGTP diphosphatase
VKQIAGVLLVATDGDLLMQLRDNKPAIANPGMITTFGGALEDDETPQQGALRELCEETSLRPHINELAFFGFYKKQESGEDVTIYLLTGIKADELEIYEGQGFVRVTKDSYPTSNLSFLAQQVVRDYYAR